MTHKFAICLYMPDMPQNVGVIIRTAACLEFPHIIKPLSFSMTDKRFKGAVMDYLSHCDLNIHNDWEDFMIYCKNENKRLILAQPRPIIVFMIMIFMVILYFLVKRHLEYQKTFIKP